MRGLSQLQWPLVLIVTNGRFWVKLAPAATLMSINLLSGQEIKWELRVAALLSGSRQMAALRDKYKGKHCRAQGWVVGLGWLLDRERKNFECSLTKQ